MLIVWIILLQLKLALMEGPDFPVALGVIRDVEAPTYDDAVNAQIEEVAAKKNIIISRNY